MKAEDLNEIKGLLKPLYELGKKVDALTKEVTGTSANHTARIKINEENIDDLQEQLHRQRNFCEEKRDQIGKRINHCGSRSDNRWFDILKSLLLVAITGIFSVLGTMHLVEKKSQPVIYQDPDRRSDYQKAKKPPGK